MQQNQLINVTNNLQMQVISNPSNSTNNSNPSNTSQQQQHGNQPSHQINAQNLIGNILNNAQNIHQQNMMHQTQNHQQQSGNIIIQQQGNTFNAQPHQMSGNIQVNIQNQSIANNMISSGTNQQSQSSQQQPTAQSILSQLTGNLVLSLSEDGRLVLRHDPNIPQDAQSQMILQTILTGALGKYF